MLSSSRNLLRDLRKKQFYRTKKDKHDLADIRQATPERYKHYVFGFRHFSDGWKHLTKASLNQQSEKFGKSKLKKMFVPTYDNIICQIGKNWSIMALAALRYMSTGWSLSKFNIKISWPD
jgi:hypothetical protein